MMKSSGLSTDPWGTPTFTSNSSLYPSPTRTRLHAFAYIPCTSRTIHSTTPSFLNTHQMTFQGTWSNTCRYTKAMYSLLLAARYFSCSCLTTKIASVVPLPGTKPNWESSIDTNCLMRRPQSSPGFSYHVLSAWDRSSCPFPVCPPFPCRGRQWNFAPSQRVPCHHEWLQLQGHGSWRRPCHRLSSPPLCLMGPVLCQTSSVR